MAASAETSPAKPQGWLTATISSMKQLEAGPPVDYSFKNLKTITDLVYESPVSGKAHHPQLDKDKDSLQYLADLVKNAESGLPPSSPSSPAGAPKHNANSVRICNNTLMSLVALDRVLYHILDDPAELIWLDASCNQLSSIEDVILKFPKLQVLYLHGNQINTLADVLKLQALPNLKKLTLHGNPISEMKNYKMWVSAHLPGLKNLDFSAITKVERDKVDVWYKAYRKKQEARN